MNYWFISAGVFLFLSLLIHMIAGDREYCALNPNKRTGESGKMFGFWLMGRGTFQLVSVDLLLTSIFIFLMGINVIPFILPVAFYCAALCRIPRVLATDIGSIKSQTGEFYLSGAVDVISDSFCFGCLRYK